ncbi:hypothetical protein IW261DRAFT_1671075 [Armillaria novae-zelandiae]|uniref:Uncharacterized protein n=1 Tax=Armillaria novae-zelandiae TaxID=153914 RepID=A0AA39NT01_9AGAR|nr:hypothetical protein IW261DRAFT_1671075 [Armillaria novae-zelandiae]
MVDSALCHYFYRAQPPVNIPEHFDASTLKNEFDVHQAVEILAEIASHRDHIPVPSFHELLEKAWSEFLRESPPRWFKNGILISSARLPPDRLTCKRRKSLSGEVTQCSTILSGSVGGYNAQEGDAYTHKERTIGLEGSVTHPSRNPTRKIAPLPKRARKSNVDVDKLTVLFFESLIHPNRVPGESRHKTEEERQYFLEHDPWVQPGSIKPQEVVCRGCGTAKKLDTRSTSAASGKPATYYPSPWVKHRNKCGSIHRDWLMEHGYDPEIKLSKKALKNCQKAIQGGE